MKQIARVLLAMDFSESAAHALPFAAALAQRHRAELHVLHVFAPEVEDAEAGGRERLSALAAPYEARGVRVRTAQRAGRHVAQAILAYAVEEAVDVIVMGTHGHGLAKRLVLGSVAEGVVSRAPCPVMTIREDLAEPAGAERRVLVPFDFSPAARRALELAGTLAETSGAALDVLHVVEPPPFLLSDVAGTFYAMIPNLDEEIRAEMRRATEGLPAGVARELHVAQGSVASRILDFAEEHGVELIVMGTRGRSAVERFLLGSAAERVLRTAPCPVLTVAAGEAP